MEVQYFKAKQSSNGINKNQKVWIVQDAGNYLLVWHKWRGKGRAVKGEMEKTNPVVGEIKSIEVDACFANKIHNKINSW